MSFERSRDFNNWYMDAWERAFTTNPFDLFKWINALGDLGIALVALPILPVLLWVDFVEWVWTSVAEAIGAATQAAEAQYKIDHADDLRMAEAERAKQSYWADLRIADLIDDPDTREAARAMAVNKYHRRLSDIMGE